MVDSLGDAGKHLFLFRTVLKPGEGLGEGTLRTQEFDDSILVDTAEPTVGLTLLGAAQAVGYSLKVQTGHPHG